MVGRLCTGNTNVHGKYAYACIDCILHCHGNPFGIIWIYQKGGNATCGQILNLRHLLFKRAICRLNGDLLNAIICACILNTLLHCLEERMHVLSERNAN